MKKWGLYLFLIGIFAFILVFLGFQFQIDNIFGDPALVIIGIVALVFILFLVGLFKERGVTEEEDASPPPEQPVGVQGLYCLACEQEITADDQFCGSCGAKVELVEPIKETPSATCPRCSMPLSPDEQFCGECGTQIPSLKEIAATETIETHREELTTGSTFAERYQILKSWVEGGWVKFIRL